MRIPPDMMDEIRAKAARRDVPPHGKLYVLESSIGSDGYATADGRILYDGGGDSLDFEGHLGEASDSDATMIIRAAADLLGLATLLSLLPVAPDDALTCPQCVATGWSHLDGRRIEVVCHKCSGVGWLKRGDSTAS